MSAFHRFILFILLGFWVSAASAVQLFLINETDANLYRVDTDALGTPVLLGQVTFGTDVIELVTASPDRLYTFDRDSNRLITISTSDATVLSTTLLDQDISPQPRGFDLSPTDGLLYGVLPTKQLRTIDPTTGATTLITPLTGVNNIEAITFAPDGTLYASASPSGNQGTHLYTIDLSTGVLSLIGDMGVEIDTLGYASDGFLYGAISGPGRRNLFRIDPATAARTTVGDTGVNSIVGITEPAVEPPVQDISIDIKPGSDTNSINVRSRGAIPVAILTTEDFDATTVDPDTVQFAGASPLRWSIDDVDGDTDWDVVYFFATQETNIACGDTEATLTGNLLDVGTPITGTDVIKTVGCRK